MPARRGAGVGLPLHPALRLQAGWPRFRPHRSLPWALQLLDSRCRIEEPTGRLERKGALALGSLFCLPKLGRRQHRLAQLRIVLGDGERNPDPE